MKLCLTVEKRNVDLKTPSKKSNRNGKIIGVIYNQKENIPVSFDSHDFNKLYQHLKSNSVIELKLNDGSEHQVILKDASRFLKTNEFQHLDFYKILPNQEIKILIPIELKGRPVGVIKGGIIRRMTDSLLVKCKVENIPEKIEVDISSLDISDFLHLRDIPKSDIVFLDSSDKAIVSVSITSKTRSTEDEAQPTEEKEEKEEVKETS